MLGHPIRLPLRAMLTHILCRSCRRKTPFGLCLSLSRGPRLEGCYAGYIALPCARCSQAMERHLRPGKLCRPAGFRFADFSAPDLYLHALPRPLPRPSSFGLLRRLHRTSLHSMFARITRWVHPPIADDYNSTFPRSSFSGLVRPYRGYFAVLLALIRSLLHG
jgi:hypothetical protein